MSIGDGTAREGVVFLFWAVITAVTATSAYGGNYELLHEQLLAAVESGNGKQVEELLLDGGSPDYVPKEFRNRPCRINQSFDAWSPFVLVAANHGHVDEMRLLVGYGADIDAQLLICTKNGIKKESTALMAALVNGHTSAVSYLLEMGADTEVEEEMYESTAIVQLARATRGEEYPGSPLEEADLKNLEMLLEANADFEREDLLGRTALWLAAASGKTEMVRALIRAGASTFLTANCRNEEVRGTHEEICTPQRIAEIRRHWEVVGVFEAAAAAAD